MIKPYSLASSQSEPGIADLYIFGDIVENMWWTDDTSPNGLLYELKQMDTLDTLSVHINSYGGTTSAGMTIYNMLKNLDAEVITYAEGFVCSAASFIFCAGSRRIMRDASLLMIHDAWSHAEGNARELRKAADDLEKISDVAANIYRSNSNLSEEKLQELLINEDWITPAEALEYGLATAIEGADVETGQSYSSCFRLIYESLTRPASAAPAATPEPKPVKTPFQRLFENFT